MSCRPFVPFCVVVCASLVAVSGASAQVTAPELSEARRQLARYDLEGDRTLRVLRNLSAFVERARDPGDIREARFLRAVVSADLLLLSDERHSFRADVARIWGSSSDAVVSLVEAELSSLQVGAYRETAADAAAAMRAAGGDVEALRQASLGGRSGAVFVELARRAVAAGSDPVAVLASLSEQPCTTESCSEIAAGFDDQGALALATVERLMAARRQLAEAASYGDPFARAICARVNEDFDAIASTPLRPVPRLPEGLSISTADGSSRRVAVDAVVSVSESRLQFGFVPVVRFDESGIRVSSRGATMLPAVHDVPMPAELRPVFRPLPDVVEAISAQVQGDEPFQVALAAGPGSNSLNFTRVLLSVQAAGGQAVALVGADGDRGLRGVPLALRRQGDAAAEDVRVRVRLGGYELREGFRSETIPRTRAVPGGPLRFDPDGLGQRLARGEHRSASVSFMSGVPTAPVLAAAFAAAPAEGSITLVLP